MVTFNEADVRQALIQTEGNLSWAAARFAAPRTDLKQYIDATPSLQALIRDLQEDVDDEAESGLRDAVCAGDKSAVCFCLKTLGRKRGYGKPMNAQEEAGMPKAKTICPFFERIKKITKEQRDVINRMARKACGGNIPDPPAYFAHLQAAGDRVRSAIETNKGNLSRAAKQLGVSRSELKVYMKEEFDVGTLVADLHEGLLDEAESALGSAVRNKEFWAQQFRLQYFSQGRGFSKFPRPSAGPPESPYELPSWLNWNWDKLTFDDMEELRLIAEKLGIDPRKPPNPYADAERNAANAAAASAAPAPEAPPSPQSNGTGTSETCPTGPVETAPVALPMPVAERGESAGRPPGDDTGQRPQRRVKKEPYQPTPEEFAKMKSILTREMSPEVARIIVDQWAEHSEFTREMVLKKLRTETIPQPQAKIPEMPPPNPATNPANPSAPQPIVILPPRQTPDALRKPPPGMEAVLARMFGAPTARNMVVCWQEVPEYIRAMAVEMLESGDFPKQATALRDAFGSFGTPPLPGAASWASSAPAGERVPQSSPEDRDDAYVDEDTEMERVLSRIYSGPDLEKALGRKPRLGLAGDKPYDCPVDPATGRLKQPPDPPGEQ